MKMFAKIGFYTCANIKKFTLRDLLIKNVCCVYYYHEYFCTIFTVLLLKPIKYKIKT